ncbi:MAG: hypothetical protein R2695_12570 [Acidimicrobiales bacterium]
MADNDNPERTNQLRRWGPIGAIVLIVAAVVVALVLSGGDDDTNTADPDGTSASTPGDSTPATTPGGSAPATDDDGITTWSEAEEAGTTGEIDWGDRCDTSIGRLAYPDFFAAECVAPFTGNNGGETAPGVTADTIKVVAYLAPEVDPVLDYITGPINNDDTPTQVFETLQGQVELYSAFFELYGREIELIRYDATGPSDDEVSAIADAEAIARHQAVHGVGRSRAGLQGVLRDPRLERRDLLVWQRRGHRPGQLPYLHTITISAEQSRIMLAEYVGKRLAGRNAVHSPEMADKERVFAYLYLETDEVSTQVANDFRDRLRDEWGSSSRR